MAKNKEKQASKTRSTKVPFEMNLGNLKFQALLLTIIGFALYANSFFNHYALDDGIVIQKNEYVQQGLRGIPKILSSDAYESFYKQMNAKQQLSGGRYRPLSVVTFAIEQQFFGTKAKVVPEDDVAFIRHFVNVALYVLSVVLLLFFLRRFVFTEHPYIAFLTCLIFLIHPMHTEVIANVKSRDEIMSFLFVVLTFSSAFKYRENKQFSDMLKAAIFYFLALLSKEYGITLVVLLPMLFYIIKGDSFAESVRACIPYFVVAGIYLLIRFSVVGAGSTTENPDVLNNPYKFATTPEKWATKIEMLNHYVRLLFWPHPLSADYSYNSIPYTNFGDWKVYLSFFTNVALIASTIVLFIRRKILAFAFAFYLLHLFLVSNLVMDIGATMGERLVYHSSFGFAMAIAMGIYWLFRNISDEKAKGFAVAGFSLLITIPAAMVVIPRNADWMDDNTLFIKDAETVPNSALANGNAGKGWIDLSERPENKGHEREFVLRSIPYLEKSIQVHKEYVNGYLNLGVAYFKLEQYEKTRELWETARKIYPNNPILKTNFHLLGLIYYNKAMAVGKNDIKAAIGYFKTATEVDPGNPDLWYNLGGASYTIQDYETARMAWKKTLELKPDYKEAQQGMQALPPVPDNR
jgi:tetratricopeptide (TPR) repeat protein